MKNTLLNTSTSTDQALIAQGRKDEAVRMTRIALLRRFGSLEHTLSLALERLEVADLEALAFDTTLTMAALQALLSHLSSRGRHLHSREGRQTALTATVVAAGRISTP